MKNIIAEYNELNLIVFSININQKKNKSGQWKKELNFPPKWTSFTMDNTYYNDKYNGLAILTGKTNNIIVIDIDNVDHWNQLLDENNKKEPITAKVITGSGGIHYYFQYDEELGDIKSTDHCFGKDYDIDVKTNGGCVIIPPSKYYNNNLGQNVEYKWENNIFDTKLAKFPVWIKNLLTKKNKDNKPSDNIGKEQFITKEIVDIVPEEDTELDFTVSELEAILCMLDKAKCDRYNDWVSVGMCLYNINKEYLLLWIKWSQQSNKYEDGLCDEKWKSFKKDKSGLKIGTLLMWAKQDNPVKYEEFMNKKKMNKMILSKYPNENLVLGETKRVSDRNYYTDIKNKECLIKGCMHNDMPNSMYIDVIDKYMTMKCKHPECHGKIYPCNHILMNKNEMNIIFNGDITININGGQDDELIEFQQIDIYGNSELNEMIFNGLNGKPSQLAEIVFYYYENDYIYGKDNEWYIFDNHRWKNVGVKNTKLRMSIQNKLKDLYKQMYKYCKENDNDKKKLLSLKHIIDSFGETTMKNNIITELIDIYTEKKDPNRDFIKKLDSDSNLIGFNNGVFDLNAFEFRDGKQEDYITLSVGYDYGDKHTNKYNELLNFLEDIQPLFKT